MTVETWTLKTSGGDYSTLAAFDADIGVGAEDLLVTNTTEQFLDCYEGHYSTNLIFSPTWGEESDATYNFTLRAATGESFFDKATSSTPLAFTSGTGVAFTSTYGGSGAWGFRQTGCSNLTIQGIQFFHNTSNFIVSIFADGSVPFRGTQSIDRCLIASGVTSEVIRYVKLYRSIVICLDDAIAYRQYIGDLAEGCTFVSPSDVSSTKIGALNGYGGGDGFNGCASFGFSTAFSGGGGDYNASDDTSAPGANSLDNLTFADQFVDVTDAGGHDFRLKSGSDLIDAGHASYTYDPDIFGTSRDSSPDIGCEEYAAASTTILPQMMQHLN